MKLLNIGLPFFIATVLWQSYNSKTLSKSLPELHIKLRDSYKIDSVKEFGKDDQTSYVYFTVSDRDKKKIVLSLKKQINFETFKRPGYTDFLFNKDAGRIYQSTYILRHFSKKPGSQTVVYTFSIDTLTNKAELDSYYY
ncbi:MAG: hypothetical protein ACXVB0_22025 [Mucilaginibacter sp.]